MRDIFDRILNTLPPNAAVEAVEDNSIAAVEKALARIELAAVESPTIQGDDGVATLFSKPMAPLLQQPQHAAATTPTPASGGARRRRRQRAFDMSAVRRSARLANARPMSQMQRAQRNLCRKLGLLHDDLEPVETALQDYIAMFNGPLPTDIIAALTEMFNLGTEEPNEVDDALLRMVGEGVEELRNAAILTAAA